MVSLCLSGCINKIIIPNLHHPFISCIVVDGMHLALRWNVADAPLVDVHHRYDRYQTDIKPTASSRTAPASWGSWASQAR